MLALVARGFDNGNVSASFKGLATKGMVPITRTPSGNAEAVDLTQEVRKQIIGAWYPFPELKTCPNAGRYPLQEMPTYDVATIEVFMAWHEGTQSALIKP